MDADMEEEVETFEACDEIDFDYEFDASRYFDFSRMESFSEMREAEHWFDFAPSDPPSPYIAKLIIGEGVVENINANAKSKDVELTNAIATNLDVDMDHVSSVLAENVRGLKTFNHIFEDKSQNKSRSVTKAPMPKGSTLMKPTASQLAKQSQPRFHKPLMQKSAKSIENSRGNENQATKRQKLEGGNLLKVPGIEQQFNLIHKASSKIGSLQQSQLKLTIPREPELVTAQRAQRMRPTNVTYIGEHVLPNAPRFKAYPLNKKILKAPSLPPWQKSTPRLPEFQEFHLRTSERAMQQLPTGSSSLPSCKNLDNVQHGHISSCILQFRGTGSDQLQCQIDFSSQTQKNSMLYQLCIFSICVPRPKVVDYQSKEGNEIAPKFKARPLNEKEFNFHTDKQLQIPPIELFHKLSLTSGPQQAIAPESKSLKSISKHKKGSKENATNSLQKEDKERGHPLPELKS